MFLIIGIIIAALFLVSTSMPFLSWMLPYYKIKKLENTDLKTKIIANLVALIAIGWVDLKFLITYIGVFVLIEILYYVFKKYGNKLQMLDKIFASTLIVGIVICIYMYFNKVSLNIGFEQLKSIYLQKTNFTKPEVELAFKYIRDNFVYLIFTYVSMTVFLTYYFLDRKNFSKWDVSYLWLIPYVIFFFLEKYTKVGGIAPSIMISVIKIVYIMYFMKIVTAVLNDKIKKQSICFVIGLFLALVSPEFAFIFGALASGIKIKIVKS